MKDIILDQSLLKEIISYDRITGEFKWKPRSSKWFKGNTIGWIKFNSTFAGNVAGKKTKDGYIEITIFGKRYQAHRLAYLYEYGKLPDEDIDHIDGVKDNNSICNIREVSRSMNLQNKNRANKNNISGILGVHYNKNSKRFASHIGVDRKTRYLGSFDTPEEARSAYVAAKKELHPGFVDKTSAD